MPLVRLFLIGTVFAGLATAQGVITTAVGSAWVFRDEFRPATSAALGRIVGVLGLSDGSILACDYDNHIVVRIFPSGTLLVVAGNGIRGYSGDDGLAWNASLNRPSGINVDSSGYLYIIDSGNHRIRYVDPDGYIGTLAGTGTAGFSGDGGKAWDARLDFTSNFVQPIGIAFDSRGYLYFSDTGNQRVRVIDFDGVISTVAGNGAAGFSGDGGPARSASLRLPAGLGFDYYDNLLIADFDNYRVRQVTPGGTISTIAGNGGPTCAGSGGLATSSSLGAVSSVGVDYDGNVVFVDSTCFRIRRINTSGTLTTLAGGTSGFSGDGGPATSAALSNPYDFTYDSNRSLVIADGSNRRVRRVNSAGIISTIAGNGQFKAAGDGGPATAASLNLPFGVAIDPTNGDMYIADTGGNKIRRVRGNTITTFAGTGLRASTGDDGPATSANFQSPTSVAVDRFGNVFVADFSGNRIRKIEPSGIIRNFAGTGSDGFSGDGGPATSATLRLVVAFLYPIGMAVDSVGNLYFPDTGNHRVRRVSASGTITTVAGNGIAGFQGDGGAATSARLNLPTAVTLDTAGNLYIAERGSHTVRRVAATTGIITTIAGTGTLGFSGDNGQATLARLDTPTSVAVDSSGNVWIADRFNERIRRVDASGVIRTFAGGGTGRDGVTATSAALNGPYAIAVDGAGNLFIAESEEDRIRKVLVSAPTFSATPSSLTFAAVAGGAATAAKTVALTTTVPGLGFTATSTSSWLQVTPSAGGMPSVLSVTANPSGLGPGSYSGQVTISSAASATGPQNISVTLTVTAADPPRLSVDPSSFTFEQVAGSGNPAARTLRINNAGGGSLSWTASATTQTGGNWLTISPTSGTATPSAPSAVQLNLNVSTLAAGTYTATITVNGAGSTARAPVTLVLTRAASSILLSQTGLYFTGVQGGGTVPSQSIGVLNVGQGSMNWTVEVQTLSGGNWLTVSPNSGTSSASSLTIPMVEIRVNATGLAAGQYSGLVRVRATGADNSPQVTTVDLNVLPAGANPGPLVRPTGLIFAAQAGGKAPGSQTVRIGTPTPGTLETTGGVTTLDQNRWLTVTPDRLVISPDDARNLTVQPTLGTLAPGIYRGAITLVFGDGSPAQSVNTLFVVTAPASGTNPDGTPVAAACTPASLLAVFRTVGNTFSSSVGWSTPLEVQVTDNCGTAVPNATVVATFSPGVSPPLVFNSLRNGVYTATWKPQSSETLVTIRVRATQGSLTPAELTASGAVGQSAVSPVLYSGGVVNGASFAAGAPVAPGSIVSLFGARLGTTSAASALPLPTVLGGATISIGGKDVPLYYSSNGQINAQVPFDVPANSNQQVYVRVRSGAAEFATVPETITVADTRPGIFMATGTQGAILLNDVLADANNPARAGSVLVVYCTGLGKTTPEVPSGQPSPSSPPAVANLLPSVTVGGVAAAVEFAGLTPSFVGLYQVNVRIPNGVAPGNAVPLIITQGGVASNTATLAVR